MQDREKLKKLVQIIGDLIKLDGNEWLIEEILKTMGEKSHVEEIAKHPFFEDIYEHCIRLVIDKQAKDFYSNFPINNEELLKNLIYDFKEMEYNRRRDRFYEFSFCLNQQIEGITNYLFDNEYLIKWRNLIENIKSQVVHDYYIEGKQIRNTLQDLIIEKEKENKNSWSAQNKFQLVYFLMTTPNNYKLPFDFQRFKNLRQEISVARNESHRGSDKFEYQKNILQQIKGNESKYYFKFYGFLQNFVSQIELVYANKSAPKNKHIVPPNKTKPQKNTLGAINPALEKLKQQLDKNK